jgi:hypothetical protein
MFYSLLEQLGETHIGTLIRENGAIFPWIEAVHVMAITLVVGSIFVVDLRLVGVASMTYPVSRLTRSLLPLTWVAFALALCSGLLLFSSQPTTYFDNFAFRLKMIMLLGAGLNMAAFHMLTARGMPMWDNQAALPMSARAAGLISILIWITIIACGRWIGFTMAPF